MKICIPSINKKDYRFDSYGRLLRDDKIVLCINEDIIKYMNDCYDNNMNGYVNLIYLPYAYNHDLKNNENWFVNIKRNVGDLALCFNFYSPDTDTYDYFGIRSNAHFSIEYRYYDDNDKMEITGFPGINLKKWMILENKIKIDAKDNDYCTIRTCNIEDKSDSFCCTYESLESALNRFLQSKEVEIYLNFASFVEGKEFMFESRKSKYRYIPFIPIDYDGDIKIVSDIHNGTKKFNKIPEDKYVWSS